MMDKNRNWWQDAVFYQIYPRSFFDSDGDGEGDLPMGAGFLRRKHGTVDLNAGEHAPEAEEQDGRDGKGLMHGHIGLYF